MRLKSSHYLKRICSLVTLAFAVCCIRNAIALTLAWDASSDATTGKVAGYKVYYSAQSFSALPGDVATNPAFTKSDVGNQTTVTINNLPAAQFYFGVTAYDTNGVESSVSNIVPFNNSGPTVSLTSPSASASFLNTDPVVVTASASSPSFSVSKVDLYDGSTLLASKTAAPYTLTQVFNVGTHTLTAKATDSNNNSTTSTAITITVNDPTAPSPNSPPTIALSSPANNSTFITNSLVTITAIASDPDGTVAKVEFFDGAILLGAVTSAPYTYTTTTLPTGTHSLTAKATDNLGATATTGATTISIFANQAPTVSISSPARNSTFLTTDTITISANASDTDGTIAKVDFMDGTTLLGTTITAPFSITVTGLIAGTHSLKAKATDNRGTTTTSRGVSITVKANVAPTIALTSPVNNSTFLTNTPITLSATASDSDGTIASVSFFDGATLLGAVTASPYSLATSLPAGTHVLTAQATDNSGQSATSSAATITVITGAPNPPTVSLVGLTAGTKLSQPFVLNASASSPGGAITQVEFFADSHSLGIATTAPYSISASISSGTYTLTAKATDSLGSVGVSSGISATIKPTGPHSLTVK